MSNEHELITTVNVDESLIRKIGENQFLKIIPSEKNIQISTIKQEKITKPIEQSDKVIIKACPTEVKLYKSPSNDFQYETTWTTMDDQKIEIPVSGLKNIFMVLKDEDLIVYDPKLNLSNILSMIIKQDTLKKKIENIKDEI